MARSSQRASRSGDLLSHMFVLGKKTIDSVKLLNLWHAGYQRCLFCWSPRDFFPPKHSVLPGLCCWIHQQGSASCGPAGDAMPWTGTWARAHCSVPLLLPNPLPARRPNPSYLAPRGSGMPRSSWRQGAGLAGSSVRFRRIGGYPDVGWYLLAERVAGQGGAQGGEAVSRHKPHPKEDRCLAPWFPVN